MPHFTRIDALKLDLSDEMKAGDHFTTDSEAQFTLGEDGTVMITKSLGCLGCDMCWPMIELGGINAHKVNATDTIYCTKPIGDDAAPRAMN
jgi:hypothetical protein